MSNDSGFCPDCSCLVVPPSVHLLADPQLLVGSYLSPLQRLSRGLRMIPHPVWQSIVLICRVTNTVKAGELLLAVLRLHLHLLPGSDDDTYLRTCCCCGSFFLNSSFVLEPLQCTAYKAQGLAGA